MIKRSRSAAINKDLHFDQKPDPPATKKHDAMVAMTRKNQNKKMTEKVNEMNEENIRAIKQFRLTKRVKQSPALANNALELKKKRKNGQ